MDAVGWMRAPLLDTSGIDGRRSWGRNKRWEYWNVTTPTHIVALTVSSLDYAAVHDVWVFDRATETAVHRGVTGILSGSATLPASLGEGPARARARDLTIDIDEMPEGTRLRAQIPGATVDIVANRPPGHESLGVVVPWSDRRFQYTVKDVARPASGTITVDGVHHDVPAGKSWAVLDHGRGRWPYDVSWNWGAGSGVSDGRVIGVQLGGQWTDGSGSTENALFVDGRLHKISEELRWEYDTTDFLRPVASPRRQPRPHLRPVLRQGHPHESRDRLVAHRPVFRLVVWRIHDAGRRRHRVRGHSGLGRRRSQSVVSARASARHRD